MVIFPGRLRKNDDVFIRAASGELPFVSVYPQETVEIVHGPSCKTSDEIFVDRCEKDGVAIVERRGGGGTVVLSQGTLVIVIVGKKRAPRENAVEIFRRVHDVIINALCQITGINAVHAGISDLAVNEKKILGSSLYIGSKPPLFYYQSSLMVSNDISLMDKYLRHPPREPEYRRGRGHSLFCTTLRELGIVAEIYALAKRMELHLKSGFGE